ncbi:MAG: mechanosensitive ion channel family protein [Luteibaculaceae bacterium]
MQEDLVILISRWSNRVVVEQLHYEGQLQAHLELLFSLIIILGIAAIIFFTTQKIILNALQRFFLSTKVTWDDHLVERKVFHGLPYLLPNFILLKSVPIILRDFPAYIKFFEKLVLLIILYVVIGAILRFANAVGDALAQNKNLKDKPVFSYVQLGQIIAILIALVFTVSIVSERSPLTVLGATGAAAAILLLVFRDSILGFVASLQISANDLVRVGDWVTVPKYGADGDIEQINLFTVKIRNFDKTLVTVPTTAFTVEGVQNWRGMRDSGGRRIKRSIYLDVQSIKFIQPLELEGLKTIKLLKEYLEKKQAEIDDFNLKNEIDDKSEVNGRRQTNLGVFRAYTELYLLNHPGVSKDMMIMVRQLQPTDKGLPLEVYCFTATTVWTEYEKIMADIFDHLFAVVKRFELKVYQSPSGSDFTRLIANSKEANNTTQKVD